MECLERRTVRPRQARLPPSRKINIQQSPSPHGRRLGQLLSVSRFPGCLLLRQNVWTWQLLADSRSEQRSDATHYGSMSFFSKEPRNSSRSDRRNRIFRLMMRKCGILRVPPRYTVWELTSRNSPARYTVQGDSPYLGPRFLGVRANWLCLP